MREGYSEHTSTINKAIMRRRHRRERMKYVIIAAVVLLMALLAGVVVFAQNARKVNITLKVEKAEMLQEAEMPSFSVKVSCEKEKQTDIVLDKETGYKVQDLLNDLNSGKGYTLQCDADGITEGKYPIKLTLTDEIAPEGKVKWKRVHIEIENGSLVVKNKYGNWKGDKFERLDGTYVTNDFIISKGKKYYFDENGNKVTGWKDIGTARYYFDEDGIMQTGWVEQDGKKYFLNDDGTMHRGWMTQGEDQYYFDSEGVMLTGNQQVGIKKCVFADDGKLESSELMLDPNKPMLALTFDDGPGPRTKELLEVLEANNAHATFFMVGTNVDKYPETIQKMYQIGCELGNHTQDHKSLTKLSPEEIQSEISIVNEKIQNITGAKPTVLRPPYGNLNDTVKANAGMPCIMWNKDSLDWQTKNTQSTIDYVLNNAKDGDVILMHDIHSATIDAALYLVPELTNRGYQLVTVSELAEAKGVTLQAGERYSQFK